MKKEVSNRARRKYGRSINKAIVVFRDTRELYDAEFYVKMIKRFYQVKQNSKKYIISGRVKNIINY